MKRKKRLSASRRSFISKSLLASALIPFAGLPLQALERGIRGSSNNPKPLNILILGGSSFLGPHQIAYALERGHKISTFTRGKTKPAIHTKLFNKVEQLIGDREDNLEALKGRKWDAVIDNSGRKVAWTEATTALLKDHVGLYVYTSSVSVYYPYYKAKLKEDTPLVLKVPEELEDENEKYTYEYGVMKANSENVVRKIFGIDKTVIIRPTFMMGPADRTNRFLYWPTRLSKDEELIVAGRKEDPVQYIDVRDIAEWMIRLIENKTVGIFNGVGPSQTMSITDYAQGARKALNSKSTMVAIDDVDFLKNNGLIFQAPWILESEKFHGMSRVTNDFSVKKGLTYRSLSITMKDTHDWWYSDAVTDARRAEYQADKNELHNRQEEIIKKWVAHKK